MQLGGCPLRKITPTRATQIVSGKTSRIEDDDRRHVADKLGDGDRSKVAAPPVGDWPVTDQRAWMAGSSASW